MTKAELLKAIEFVPDNAEITFNGPEYHFKIKEIWYGFFDEEDSAYDYEPIDFFGGCTDGIDSVMFQYGEVLSSIYDED